MTTDDMVEERRKPAFLSQAALREIHTTLAILNTKMDQVLKVHRRMDSAEATIQDLQIFKAQVKTWGIVAGGIWSAILAILGATVWSIM